MLLNLPLHRLIFADVFTEFCLNRRGRCPCTYIFRYTLVFRCITYHYITPLRNTKKPCLAVRQRHWLVLLRRVARLARLHERRQGALGNLGFGQVRKPCGCFPEEHTYKLTRTHTTLRSWETLTRLSMQSWQHVPKQSAKILVNGMSAERG